MTEKTVAIYGAGIAGLTAAHELSRRGWHVRVFESNSEVGGFFRSTRRAADDDMPSEYSWHGMGPWYHNAFDLMKQIPFDSLGSIYERALSRPIDFGVATDRGEAQFDDSEGVTVDVGKMFGMSTRDRRRWIWLMLKTWTANRRSAHYYARLNAAAVFKKRLSPRAWSTWVACFGPWI